MNQTGKRQERLKWLVELKPTILLLKIEPSSANHESSICITVKIFNLGFSDADLQEKSRIERQEIVDRYDLGRDEGAKIDDWEDPKLEVYHKQDRWGFIQ